MSKSVVTAAAKAKAVELERNKQLTQQAEGHARQADDHKPAAEEQAVADHEQEAGVVVDNEAAQAPEDSAADLSLAGDFSFQGALADAGGSIAALVSEAEAADQEGFAMFGGDDGDGSGGFLLIGAIALVALGGYVLFKGNGHSNDAPVFAAATRAVTVSEDTAAGVTFTADATDGDGDALVYTASTPANGTVTISGSAITFKPAANFAGSTSFTLTATDPDGEVATQTVNVTVTPVNDNPTGAATIALAATEDTPATVAAGITDVDAGSVLTYTSTNGAKGTVSVAANGTITYTPNANATGADTFTVTASDGVAGSTPFTTTVNVTIAGVNDQPVAGPQNTTTITIEQDTSGTFRVDFNDPDGDALTATVADQPDHGDIGTTANPFVYSYTPDDGFFGTDTFQITVTDGTSPVTYTVTVNVTEVEEAIVSIDVPPSGAAVVFDAGDDDFIFTDTLTGRTDVILQNFTANDLIRITGIDDPSDYSFGTRPGDAKDLRITYNDGTNFNQIIIDDVLDGSSFVFDYDTAVDAIGFNFISIA